MRYFRYAFLLVLALIIVSISMANRSAVTLHLLPEGMVELFGFNLAVTLPVFVVVLAGIVAGIILGFVWEWLREGKQRRDAGRKSREVRRLEREVDRMKKEKNKDKDEVLAILDEAV